MSFTDRFLGLETRRHDKKFKAINKALAEHWESPDLDMVREAFELAKYIHADQRRKMADEAYIVHPLDVALACAEHQMDDVSIAAAILHDCIEDAEPALGLTRDVISSRFGADVGVIVDGLTKLRTENVSGAQDAKAETLKKLITTTATDDIRTIVIKIFDRVDNIRTVDVFREEKQRRIAAETIQFYVPIAARLGFFKEAREMEDHVMRVLNPGVYRAITRWLSSNTRSIQRNVEKSVKKIVKELKNKGVQCRYQLYAKGIDTIFHELETRGLPISRIDEGRNFNLCLIVDDEDACFRALNLIHDRFIHNPTGVRDFINNPKVNGYQSLHTICTGREIPWIQVMIRTEEMHVANHLGVITQLRAGKLNDTGWLMELLDSMHDAAPDELLAVTSSVFYAEIDVMTPRGDRLKLPVGSTALDFAYLIHTEVGDTAKSCIVDGRARPLRAVLRSGQRVEIVTSDEVRPSYRRFGWVKTPRATNCLRKAMQRAERDAIARETTLFLQFLARTTGIILRPDMPEFEALLDSMGMDSEWEFGSELHAGRLKYERALPHAVEIAPDPSFRELIKRLEKDGLLTDEEGQDARRMKSERAQRSLLRDLICEEVHPGRQLDPSVVIAGIRDPLPLKLAGCCLPVFGDDIVVHSGRDRKPKLHRRTCKSVRYMVEYESVHIAPAMWRREPPLQLMRVDITGRDRRGLLLAVSQVLVKLKLDAQTVKLSGRREDGTAAGYAMLEVNDLTDIDTVVQRLEAIPGITSAKPSLTP